MRREIAAQHQITSQKRSVNGWLSSGCIRLVSG